MNLIIGGAYQGKLEYAEEVFGKQEVFTCSPERAELDFSKPVLYHLEGIEAREYLRQHRPELDGKVIICTDISQGIVPVETQMRALREMTGRAMVYLAKEADTVTRVFCGLGQKLK